MEEQPLESGEEQDYDEPEEHGQEDNFGFEPLPEPQAERRERRDTGSPACEARRQQINRLLCRYPNLKLRSSETTMKQLMQYDEQELENILTNATNDLAAIRGAPMSEFLIHTLAGLVDTFFLPGFLDRCLADEELKNDVEAEATLVSGCCGNKTNIAFRSLNHAYVQKFRPQTPLPQKRATQVQRRVPQHFQPISDLEEQNEQHNQRVGTGREFNSTSDANIGMRTEYNG